MEIFINEKFYKEKKYILDEIISRQLGIPFTLKIHNKKEYIIVLKNNKKITFSDAFFSNINNSSFISKNNLPTSTKEIKYSDVSVLSLYGNNTFIKNKNHYTVGADLFASAFFMLTRWEELFREGTDHHQRFTLYNSVAYQFGFHRRPIVNEYICFLKSLIRDLCKDYKFKNHKFEVLNTHDIDHISYWNRKNALLFYTAKSLLRNKSIEKTFSIWKNFLNVKLLKREKDPYDTFDLFMDISEKNKIKSHFYFLLSNETKYDSNNSVQNDVLKSVINNIESRNHIVGFHPSYNSYNNERIWNQEYNRLNDIVRDRVSEGRQHYLRVKMPDTLRFWEKKNLIFDSSLGYVEDMGFRCGICTEFSLFDVIKREEMRLKEKPLIIMDVTLKTYLKEQRESISSDVKNLIQLIKKYNGILVILWHNNNTNEEWNQLFTLYQEILEEASSLEK